MRHLFIFAALLQFLWADLATGQEECKVGWATFTTTTKCIKLIGERLTRDEALKKCESDDSELLTINSEEEQTVLNKYLFEDSEIVDDIWLGAKRNTNGQFVWDDDSDIVYENWANGNPSDNFEKKCVLMTSGFYMKNSSSQATDGKWIDATCGRTYVPVCQKLKRWTNEKLLKAILDLEVSMKNLEKNIVPIGFVYVQLYGYPGPSELWGQFNWCDISNKFAGKFFRVEGGKAASFGETQMESAPRLTDVRTVQIESLNSNLTIGDWSRGVSSGTLGNPMTVGLSFFTTDEEIRPTNEAVKLWQRTDDESCSQRD